jgi:hypothetical protein
VRGIVRPDVGLGRRGLRSTVQPGQQRLAWQFRPGVDVVACLICLVVERDRRV